MNRIINIHLAGSVFYIDETAYQLLKNYLLAIENALQTTSDPKEIMYDIEQRISELLKVELNDRKAAIKEDVEKIIHEMGKPESYKDPFEKTEFQQQNLPLFSKPKKLFRKKQGKYVAGVCGGIASYLGIDPIWVRLIAVLFLFFTSFSSVLIYIVLWGLLPYAKTTSDKLRMYGQPINFSTIKKSFQERYSEESRARLRNTTSKMGNAIENIIQKLLSILPKILGIFLIVIGVFAISMMGFLKAATFVEPNNFYIISIFTTLFGFLSLFTGVLILRKIK